MDKLIGREIQFDCQPYDRGRGTIKSIRPGSHGWEKYFVIEVDVIEGQTRNRLFGAVSHTPMAVGKTLTMYHYSAQQLADAVDAGSTLIHVYPV